MLGDIKHMADMTGRQQQPAKDAELRRFERPQAQYRRQQVLGRSATGQVNQLQRLSDGRLFACKVWCWVCEVLPNS